jgi:lipooligosaccharide transport system ATP-binding protein
MDRLIVEAKDLTKIYDREAVVDGISFVVRERECFGILGPNGAGKTTTIKMICCFSPVTQGELRVFDLSVMESNHSTIKSKVGVVPQENNLDPDLSVIQNLLVYAGYFNIPKKEAKKRANELVDFMQLAEKTDAMISKLSGGMRRRLTLARGLINSPLLLVLDEPTTGLDPQARHMVWEKLRALSGSGVTMLLSTQYMEEATQLCHRLIIMDHGKIIAEGSPEGLISRHVGREVVEVFLPWGKQEQILRRCSELVEKVERSGDKLYVFPNGAKEYKALIEILDGERFLHREASLEDVFLKLTGRELRE